jgi:hypothetical protein
MTNSGAKRLISRKVIDIENKETNNTRYKLRQTINTTTIYKQVKSTKTGHKITALVMWHKNLKIWNLGGKGGGDSADKL